MTNLSEEQFEEKLKQLSRDFEFFAHVTSHDLRDPLRQAHIYIDEILPNIPQELKGRVVQIHDLIDTVLQKIAVLRDFSYVANDKEEPLELDLNVIVASIIEKYKTQYPSIKADIANLPKVMGSSNNIPRLFELLIDNAVKFSKDRQNIVINLKVAKEDEFWHFILSDEGIGLDEIYKELVFVLFQKLDTEEENENLGAGLAFAKKIIENHKGTIWYESKEEGPTYFHFTLPCI